MTDRPLSLARVVRFWLPLAGTWLMMSLEGPLLAAVIARLADPVRNLAAYGVAFSLAMIVEAPVIMMLSAATALVRDGDSYRRLRSFSRRLNATVTAVLVVLVLPPVFHVVADGLLGLTPDLAGRAHLALALFLPWPATIGYRRFYQGIMIWAGQTERVAWGTVVRLLTMASTALVLATSSSLDGAAVGAAALSAGVTLEAVTSRLMAAGAVRRALAAEATPVPLTTRSIVSFYTPLAMTSLIALAVHPLATFFMGHGRFPLESLAVMPVVGGLVFVFRGLGLAAQEVFIALMDAAGTARAVLARFAAGLAAATTVLLAIIAWTPLAQLWFVDVSGLSPELTAFAIVPLRILAVIPALTVLLCWQRAMLVNAKRTGPVTLATTLEITVAAAVLSLGVFVLDLTGVVVAAAALVVGRLCASLYLLMQAAAERRRAAPQRM